MAGRPDPSRAYLDAPLVRTVDGVPPGSVPSTFLGTGALTAAKGGKTIEARLPYIAFYNSDSVAHSLTFKPGGTTGEGGTGVTISLAAGASASMPTAVFTSVEDASANGDVFWWYSDVPNTGPRPAAGGGASTATSVGAFFETTNFQPSSNATFLMAGFGSTAKITPKSANGMVWVGFFGALKVGAAGDTVQVQVRYGTGSAPAQNAAATGTTLGGSGNAVAIVSPNALAGLTGSWPYMIGGIAPGLTPNTAYWFDLACYITSAAGGDLIWATIAGVFELPN